MKKMFAAAAVSMLAAGLPAHATISVSSPAFVYNQDFNSLTTTTGTTVAWANDSTLAGWSLFNVAGAAITTYGADDGGSNTGAFRSHGGAGSTERALGGVASGGAYFGSPVADTVAGYIAVAFTNTSGVALSGFNLSFNGEQWRNGGNTSAQTMALQYGFGASFGAVSNWVAPGGNFDWTSPVVGATAAAVDGNAAGRVTGLGGVVNTNWTAGNTLWVRWIEKNDLGNDHGLAIDDLKLTVTAVPEPETWALMLAGVGAMVFVARRRA
jgi:PEP-CTERM motif